MAVPFENPMVATILPLILSCAPGDDLAIDALRLYLLGVASVHRSFLPSRSQACSDSAKETRAVANTFGLKSKQTLTKACCTPRDARSVVSNFTDGRECPYGVTFGLHAEKLKTFRPRSWIRWYLTQIFAGGHNRTKSLALAKTLVNIRGGPEILLSRSATDEPALRASNGVFRAKLMLEILAVYDIFGGYVLGRGGHTHPLPPGAPASLFLRHGG
jgi:hypothetical protein